MKYEAVSNFHMRRWFAGVEWVGGKIGLWVCGVGIAQEYPRGRRPSHAVVAGCGAAVEGGWGLRGFAG